MKRALAVLAVLAAALAVVVVVALVPPSFRYDAAPVVRALQESATLPIAPVAPARRDVVLRGVRLVGGGPAPVDVRVEGGVVARIDPHVAGDVDAPADAARAAPVDDVPVRDLRGAYLMPGLIDAHVHVSMAPGAALRLDDAAATAQLRAHHLRAYVASGVTTILDTGVDDDVARHVQRRLAAGHAGPRYLHVGPPLVVPDGYVADLFPWPLTDEASVAAHLDRLRAAGAVGAKIPIEPGVIQRVWRTPSRELQAAVTKLTQARGVPLYVHAMSEDAYDEGLALRPHAFVHHSRSASDDLVARVATSGAYVISTLAIWRVHEYGRNRAALDEPHVRRVVPAVVRDGLLDDARMHAAEVGLIGKVMPVLAGRWADVAAHLQARAPAQVDAAAKESLRVAADGLRRMHAAGVPVVLGSDAGNWPVFPYYLHGPTTILELEMLVQAGLTPADAIAAATVVPARMLGLDDVGAVAVGKRADLVVTGVDPLVDVGRALRDVRLVVKDGVARTPDEWMTAE